MKTRAFNDTLFHVCNGIFFGLFSLACVYPFYYVLLYSVSIPELAAKGIGLWPRGFTFENYASIFASNNIAGAALVSAARTVLGAALTLLCCSTFAYGLSKNRTPFRKLMYRATVISMYFSAGLIPWYVTMRAYGLKNNFLLYILPSAVSAFYLLLIKTYFEQLPAAIEESAEIDGANSFTVLFKIVLPVSKPILASVVIFSAVNQWNAWTDNLYLCTDARLQTLQLVLYRYLSQASAAMLDVAKADAENRATLPTTTSIKMTITAITALPILIIYPAFQKQFAKGIMLGAVKG